MTNIVFKAYDVEEERTLIPTPREFRVEHNPSYVASLVTGVFSPILHLPQIVFFGLLWPFVKSLVKAIFFLIVSFLAGITGRATGVRVKQMTPRELSQDEKRKALAEMLEGTGFMAVPINGRAVVDEDAAGTGQH